MLSLLLFAQAVVPAPAPTGTTVSVSGEWLVGAALTAVGGFGTSLVVCTKMILAYLAKRDLQEKETTATLLQVSNQSTAALQQSTAAILKMSEVVDDANDVNRRHRHAMIDLAHAAGLKKAAADARERNGLPREEPPVVKHEER